MGPKIITNDISNTDYFNLTDHEIINRSSL